MQNPTNQTQLIYLASIHSPTPWVENTNTNTNTDNNMDININKHNQAHLIYLASIHGPQSVCREVAQDASTPMHVLQHPLGIILGGAPQALPHLLIPEARNLLHAYVPCQQLLLQLIPVSALGWYYYYNSCYYHCYGHYHYHHHYQCCSSKVALVQSQAAVVPLWPFGSPATRLCSLTSKVSGTTLRTQCLLQILCTISLSLTCKTANSMS